MSSRTFCRHWIVIETVFRSYCRNFVYITSCWPTANAVDDTQRSAQRRWLVGKFNIGLKMSRTSFIPWEAKSWSVSHCMLIFRFLSLRAVLVRIHMPMEKILTQTQCIILWCMLLVRLTSVMIFSAKRFLVMPRWSGTKPFSSTQIVTDSAAYPSDSETNLSQSR